ncbi:MAG: hypothetical protein S4CHLAM81_01430 [Chlamydiales bacterium]|nr:hypothetical protein [Chlamydiales bacterium]MCH9634939.1 hypothetical protein [Chlamydiales bacterium]
MTAAVGSVAPGSDVRGGAPVDHSAFGGNGKTLPEEAIMILLIEGLKLHKANLKVKADQLEGSAAEQNRIENAVKEIHNVIPDTNATNAELQHDNALNQQLNSVRSNFEDVLITLRQTAHVLMSESSQETNEVQQASSVVSFVLKTYLSEGAQIVKMDGRS